MYRYGMWKRIWKPTKVLHVMASAEFKLQKKRFDLDIAKALYSYMVLISLSKKRIWKLNLKAEGKFTVNQYEVSIDNKAHVITSWICRYDTQIKCLMYFENLFSTPKIIYVNSRGTKKNTDFVF